MVRDVRSQLQRTLLASACALVAMDCCAQDATLLTPVIESNASKNRVSAGPKVQFDAPQDAAKPVPELSSLSPPPASNSQTPSQQASEPEADRAPLYTGKSLFRRLVELNPPSLSKLASQQVNVPRQQPETPKRDQDAEYWRRVAPGFYQVKQSGSQMRGGSLAQGEPQLQRSRPLIQGSAPVQSSAPIYGGAPIQGGAFVREQPFGAVSQPPVSSGRVAALPASAGTPQFVPKTPGYYEQAIPSGTPIVGSSHFVAPEKPIYDYVARVTVPAQVPSHHTAAQADPLPVFPVGARGPAPLQTDNLLWWQGHVDKPLRKATESITVNVTALMEAAARNSGRILAIKQAPWISAAELQQAEAGLDPTFYSSAKFDSSSDPVGNTLTTGGPPRLEEDVVSMEAGVRGENKYGANYNISQDADHTNSNSTFFIPQDQGTTRLSANLTQPLLRGRQINATRSLILTAQFETVSAQAEYLDELQQHLTDVANTYWSLYQERATYLLRVRHLERAQAIATQLEQRQTLDSLGSQIDRARADVATRMADLSLSDANIRNAESRLRALLNASGLSDRHLAELVPVQQAKLQDAIFHIEEEVSAALNRRPEIHQLNGQIGVANVNLKLATDQTKPLLNLVTEGYVAGLAGESDIFGSINNQFSDGRPGFAAGFEFERPYRNRGAKALVRRRMGELHQLENKMREQRANIRNEVESAIRNLDANRRTVVSREKSLLAVIAEVNHKEDRWRSGDPRLGQQLDDLLNAHTRLLTEEQNLLAALVDYNRTLIELQRATGALVQFSD